MTLIVLLGWSLSLLHAQQPDFVRDVWPVLERAQCRQCHSENGVGSTTRLQFPPEQATTTEIRDFGLWLKQFDTLLWRKPTARVPHGGAERIKQGSPEDRQLQLWAAYVATLPASSIPARASAKASSTRVLRRLTHSQYNHTVRDLLGDQTKPADQFPKEDFVHGFTNQADGQSISPLQAEAYARAAERLSRLIKRVEPDFIARFGMRAFRRPLGASELARYEKLKASQPDPVKGVQAVAEAMLQSPHFLFHLEPGAFGAASKLSYFLWDTMPDDTLLAAAAKGELDTRPGLERQIKRMLADDRARIALDEFLGQWLRLDRLRGAIRDRRLFPEYSPELVGLMIEETTRLFRSLVWNNGNFMDFFSARYTHLVPELARLYQLEAGPEPWAKVTFPEPFARAGILGQASFLTLTSKPGETSPTERGIFIREHFLCQQVPPPPAGVNATLPPVTEEKPITQRERLQIHLSNPVCAGCHTLVDPIGFGFENFDAIGRYRDTELIVIYPSADDLKTKRKTKPSEFHLPIAAKGEVRGLANSAFTMPSQLGQRLAEDTNCQKCVVKQLFRYAMGRKEESGDQVAIDKALEKFRESNFRFQDLIMAIALGN